VDTNTGLSIILGQCLGSEKIEKFLLKTLGQQEQARAESALTPISEEMEELSESHELLPTRPDN